jgi:magnesium chelatase subunit D
VPRALAAAVRLASTGVAGVVLDCETGRIRLGLAGDLAVALNADLLPLAEVAADALMSVVRGRRVGVRGGGGQRPRTPRQNEPTAIIGVA